MRRFLVLFSAVAWTVAAWTADDAFPGAAGTLRVGCNYWASHAGTYMWRNWNEAVVKADLDRLSEYGVTELRVFPLWPDFQPLTAEFGVRGVFHNFAQAGGELKNYAAVDDEMVARFRRLCDLADAHGMRLVVGLVTGWMSGRMFAPPALERMNALTDRESIRWQCRFVRYFVNAMKDHPAIRAWDLGNECNGMGDCTGVELWSWMHAIASEIRLADPSRPVVSGMHGISSARGAVKNLREQGELVDVLTTHPYPLWTPGCNTEPYDTIRNGCHAACETTYYAALTGRPAFVEEAGSMGPGIVSETRAAASMRTALFSCWAAGVPAFLWWCSSDFDRLDFAPYGWTTVERELGLFTSDGRPKPTAVQLRAFSEFLKSLPFDALPPRSVDAVVVVSERENAWSSSFGAWTLAREAGFDVTYAFAESDLPAADFYILPSGTTTYETYSSRAFARVLEKARHGATVLLTHGDGAILAGLRAAAGVEIDCQYQEPCTVAVACGADAFSFREPVTQVVSAHEAKTLLADTSGRPVLTENALGKGRILFFNGALERNAKIAGWPVYRIAAERAGVSKTVRKGLATVGVSEHPAGDGRLFAVVVNYAPTSVQCPLTIAGTVRNVWGQAAYDGKVLSLGANDGCVMEVVK